MESYLPAAPTSPPTLGIGLLGCGVVGRGVVQLLSDRPEQLRRHATQTLALRRVAVRSRTDDRGLEPTLLTTQPREVVDDPSVQIVVEVMGGVEPARDLIRRALELGKPVVTANKEVLAKHGRELFQAARDSGTALLFEAAVGGAIPVIMALRDSLAANRLTGLYGIVNGTTNYILSQMAAHQTDYAVALAQAQQLGFAEADPTSDVEGHDAAYKLTLLASLMLGDHVQVTDVHREGITRITARDLAYARELGYAIKLLGIAKHQGDRLETRVHPTMIPLGHPLARIDGATNAITMVGDAAGEVTLSGPGAGSLPTASAVMGDVLAAARSLGRPPIPPFPCHDSPRPCAMGDVETAYYLRLITEDMPGVLGAVGGLFGAQGVSILSFVQKEVVDGCAELVFVTHRIREAAVMAALDQVRLLPSVREVANLIRVEDNAHDH